MDYLLERRSARRAGRVRSTGRCHVDDGAIEELIEGTRRNDCAGIEARAHAHLLLVFAGDLQDAQSNDALLDDEGLKRIGIGVGQHGGTRNKDTRFAGPYLDPRRREHLSA